MAVQYSTTLRNAQLDAIETVIGTAPKLQIRTGTQPATAATAASGTLLAEITCPSDWLAAASSGAKALSGSWSVAATTTGTAGHFRILDSSGATCHMQGSISVTGGNGDLQLDNLSLVATQTVTVTTFTIAAGNA
jgi:hypothetical protein